MRTFINVVDSMLEKKLKDSSLSFKFTSHKNNAKNRTEYAQVYITLTLVDEYQNFTVELMRAYTGYKPYPVIVINTFTDTEENERLFHTEEELKKYLVSIFETKEFDTQIKYIEELASYAPGIF